MNSASSPPNSLRKVAVRSRCAATSYLRKHGRPKLPADLAAHACIGYTHAATGNEWHLLDADGVEHVARANHTMQTNNGDTARSAAPPGSA
jgi:DNA-binding transcriptional LysR family regulator